MKNPQALKNLLNWAGAALGLAGVVFVGLKFRSQAEAVDWRLFGPWAWLQLGMLALAYGAANGFLARAWWQLLQMLGVEASWRWALRAYGISQLAKYVPGNVFQFAGRQALGQAAGHGGRLIARSTLYELILLSVSGAGFTALAVPLLAPALPMWSGVPALIAVMAVMAWFAGRRWGGSMRMAVILECLFLACSAVVFLHILRMVAGPTFQLDLAPVVCGAFVLSWLAGLLTPGAPAGIGVRELILVLLLGQWIVEPQLLLTVVVARLVTMAGDLLFFGFSGLVPMPRR